MASVCAAPTPTEQLFVSDFDGPVLPPALEPRSRIPGRPPLLVKVQDVGHVSWSLMAEVTDPKPVNRVYHAASMCEDGKLLVFSTSYPADKAQESHMDQRDEWGLVVEVNAVKYNKTAFDSELLHREEFSPADAPGNGMYPSFNKTADGPVVDYVYDYAFFDHDKDEKERKEFDAKYARAAARSVAAVKPPLSGVKLALPAKSFINMYLERVVRTPDGLRVLKTHQTDCSPMTDLQGQLVGVFSRPADMRHGWVAAFAVDAHGRYHLLVSHPLGGNMPLAKPNLYSMLVFGPDFKPLGRWAVQATKKDYHSVGLCIDDGGNCVVYFDYGYRPCKAKLIVFTAFGQRITQVSCPKRKSSKFKGVSLCHDGGVLVLHRNRAFRGRFANLEYFGNSK
jgi:hypothetical protein